jgi:integrase
VFNELARLGVWHGGNPLSDLRQYKVQESELAYLSQDEIEQLLDACKEQRDLWLVVMLCLSTGARWSEIEKVSRAQIGMGRITFTKTKGKRNRTVPVAPWLLAMLPKRTGRLFDDCYASRAEHPRSAAYLCQPLHDERRQHLGATAHPWPHRHQDDDALFALCTRSSGRCGASQPHHSAEKCT